MESMLYTVAHEQETKRSRGNWMWKTVFVARFAEGGWRLDDAGIPDRPARNLSHRTSRRLATRVTSGDSNDSVAGVFALRAKHRALGSRHGRIASPHRPGGIPVCNRGVSVSHGGLVSHA